MPLSVTGQPQLLTPTASSADDTSSRTPTRHPRPHGLLPRRPEKFTSDLNVANSWLSQSTTPTVILPSDSSMLLVLGSTDIVEMICVHLTYQEKARLAQVSKVMYAGTQLLLLHTVEGRHLSAISISTVSQLVPVCGSVCKLELASHSATYRQSA